MCDFPNCTFFLILEHSEKLCHVFVHSWKRKPSAPIGFGEPSWSSSFGFHWEKLTNRETIFTLFQWLITTKMYERLFFTKKGNSSTYFEIVSVVIQFFLPSIPKSKKRVEFGKESPLYFLKWSCKNLFDQKHSLFSI